MKYLLNILINLFVLTQFLGISHAFPWPAVLPPIANGLKYRSLAALDGEWVFRVQGEEAAERFEFHACSIGYYDVDGMSVYAISNSTCNEWVTDDTYYIFELEPGRFELYRWYERYIFTVKSPGEVTGCAYSFVDWETCHQFTGMKL